MVIIKSKQKTSPQSYKTQIKIRKKNFFPGLAKSGSEQPGPGATLLGWPRFIYYNKTQALHYTRNKIFLSDINGT